MPTVEQLTVAFDNAVSGGAQAAADDLERLAAASERVGQAATATDQVIKRAGASLDTIARQTDGKAAADARAEAAARRYEAAVDRVTTAVQAGNLSVQQAGQMVQRLGVIRDQDTAKAVAQGQAIESRFAPATVATAALGAATEKVGASAGQTSFALRQLGVQAMQAFSGVATGQSVMQVAIQQGHQVADVALSTGTGFSILGTAARAVAGAVFSIPGAAVAAGAALVAMGAASESSERRLHTLQDQLRATRADYMAMAAEVQAAARGVSSTSGIGTSDARTAAQTIGSAPDFRGSQTQLEGLIRTAGDMAVVFGETVPVAAKELASALADPAAEAEKLAKEHFPGMTRALADSIEIMARGGDRAGAFARDLAVLQNGTKGANDNLTDFQKALRDLGNAFDRTDGQGRSFVNTLGHGIMEAAALAISALAGVVHGIEKVYEAATSAPSAPAGQHVLTSSAGALGVMGLMPGTASAMHVNPNLPDQNIMGGLEYIQQLSKTYGTNQDAIAGAYNAGPGRYNDFVAGRRALPDETRAYIPAVRGADTGVLNSRTVMNGSQTMSVAQAIQFWGDSLGMPQWQIDLGKRIAVTESGGRQFASGASVPTITVHAPASAASGSAVAAPAESDSLRQALDLANSLGATGSKDSAFQKAYDNLQLLRSGLADLGPETTQNSVQFDALTDAVSKVQKAMYDAFPAASRLLETNDRQIADTKALTDAYLTGGDAIVRVTAEQKAYQQALAAGFNPADPKFSEMLPALTDQNVRDQHGQGDLKLAQTTDQNRDQLDYLRAETASLGANDQARVLYLAHIQAEQVALRETHDLNSTAAQDYIKSADSIAAATQAYQNQKAALDTVSADISRAFTTMSDSITQAFVSGQGHAVNFGNIMKGVAEQIVSEFLKLAVINPLLNSILGQSNVTLSGAINAIGGGAAGGAAGVAGASGGGIGSLLSTGSSLYSIGSSAGILPGAGSIGSALGLTGPGGLLSGVGSGISGALGTIILGDGGTVASAAAGTGAATSIIGTGGAAAGQVTLGGLLGGVGGGAALGMLEGSLFGPGTKQSQTIGTIGSIGGAAAGAAIGSIIPGIGTLIGGLIGGALGGAGGIFGPGAPNPYSRIPITTANGQIVVGDASSQGLDQRAVNDSLVQTQTEAANINSLLKANGLAISNQIGVVQIGQNSPKGYQDPTKYGSLDAAFSNYRFQPTADAANDNPQMADALSRALQGQSFASANDLTSRISDVQNWITQVIPALQNYGTPQGSLQQAQSQIAQSFGSALVKAGQLNQDTSGFTDMENAALAKAQADADRSAGDLMAGNQGSYLQARATVTGSASDAMNAKLTVFDQSASDQKYQLDQQLTGIYGAAYRSTQAYADQMATQDQSLAEQRLAIQKQYDDQTLQRAHQTADSLASNQLGYGTAMAQLSGDPAQIEAAKLNEFDQSSSDQKYQLDKQLTDAYGVAYRTTADYAAQMTAQEQNFGAQRLVIQKQYNDQILSTANGTISSLAQYAQSLQFGSESPLRPQAQYSLATSEYNAVSGAALAGDYTSLQQFQSYATQFLSASRSVNGSGQQYVADFDKVMAALSQIGTMTPDTLTASVLQAETRTQTQTLNTSLQQIVTAIKGLQQQMGAAANMPARIAA